jgi:hypothetical protein
VPSKRPSFFVGELLTAERLNALLDHLDRSNREHLLALHGAGVIDGLQVSLTRASTINVTAGMAVDPLGRLVTLEGPARLSVADPPFTGAVVLQVEETPADAVCTSSGTEFSAVETVVGVATTTTPSPNQLVLARYVSGRRVRAK